MTPKICTPLMPTTHELLSLGLQEAKQKVDLVEFYTDYLPTVTSEDLGQIKAYFPEAILTLRRPRFEKTAKTVQEQEGTIELIAHHGLAVDLDIRQEASLLKIAQQKKVSIVASYHNYASTPSTSELDSIAEELLSLDSYAIKISCACIEHNDGLRLLELLTKLQQRSSKIVVSAMGKASLPIRVLAGLWGSAWVYAPLTVSSSTAEGQVEVSKLRELFKLYQGA